MNFGQMLDDPEREETKKKNAAIKKERDRLEDVLDAINNLVAYSNKTQGYY
jgi:ribosomal protein S2